jgi:GNAT superfamily N-acetyltransferase
VNPPDWPRQLLSRIEDAGLNASAAPQQRWVDGWLVRYSPGKAQRARCINALSSGLLPLAEKLALCQDVFDQAGLRLLLRITPYSQPEGLDLWLAQRGYQRFDESRVMVCPTLQFDTPTACPAGLRLDDVSTEAYAHIVGGLRGTEIGAREAHAQRLQLSPVPYRGSVLYAADGSVQACAQVAIEADLVGLYDVFTAPQVRGQGLSRWLCGRLLHRAQEHGARRAYLQVDAKNHAARAVYQRLGFADAYSYHYRALPTALD